ncbi:MAG TPA: cell envelope integrity EipB family protein [Candidatus Cybelea sp.]|nr:cell envelope integrity EipB family protein [Candidatus Cybelea sp.]
MLLRFLVLAGLAAAGSLVAVGAGAIEPLKLASHRAVYELTLDRPDPSGSVVSLRGRLVMEFQNVCDGYTLNQRIHTEMTNDEDNDLISDFTTTSWESHDGRRFRFSLKNDINGETEEEYIGSADTDAGLKGGHARFTKPKSKHMVLPPRTVFPNEHLETLIRGAMAGQLMLPVRVFDGSGDDGLYETGGYIGKPFEPVNASEGVLKPLAGVRSWPVHIAYFPLLTKAETPEYQISFRLFANGVSGDLVLDYGDYAMKGTLTRLDLLPEHGC